MTCKKNKKILKGSKIVFWDFDGVIKESVGVKGRAFVELFKEKSANLQKKILLHHGKNGGVSRFKKIPIYLRWAGYPPSQRMVKKYCDKFSKIIFQKIKKASWVPGVEKILRGNPYRQRHYLITATPLSEIIKILTALKLKASFSGVYGAPQNKRQCVRRALAHANKKPAECLMIGDSEADWIAAQSLGVPFLLRENSHNRKFAEEFPGRKIRDFIRL